MSWFVRWFTYIFGYAFQTLPEGEEADAERQTALPHDAPGRLAAPGEERHESHEEADQDRDRGVRHVVEARRDLRRLAAEPRDDRSGGPEEDHEARSAEERDREN